MKIDTRGVFTTAEQQLTLRQDEVRAWNQAVDSYKDQPRRNPFTYTADIVRGVSSFVRKDLSPSRRKDTLVVIDSGAALFVVGEASAQAGTNLISSYMHQLPVGGAEVTLTALGLFMLNRMSRRGQISRLANDILHE